jgi:dUTP pyrophosphatase
MTPGSAGMDLASAADGPVSVPAGERVGIPTGWAMELPPGYEAQVRPRSGLAWRSGLTVVNSPGTIDSDYRGEVVVLLVNLSKQPVVVQPGDRVAQMVIAPVIQGAVEEVADLSSSQRGEGGFGHTG